MASAEVGDRLVGETLGDTYRIARIVGEGGMGRVYEARHTRISTRRFAIKTVHEELSRRPDVVTRFKREAEAAAAISSPHVVGVYDYGRTPTGQPYLVAEFLSGGDLGDRLDQVGKLDAATLVPIVRQVCSGLAAAHDKGVVHRDIKPDNVVLVGDRDKPIAKIIDFGISHIAAAQGTALTRTGMIMGTPAYMAPEQARGTRVDHRADIYAVGAILYRGLTGTLPFDKPDSAAMLAAVLLEEPAPPRSLEPSIPEALEVVIQKAMAKEPEDRYQNIHELEEALAPFQDMPGARPGTPQRSAASAHASRSSTSLLGGYAHEVRFARPLVAMTGVLLAVSGLAALFLAVAGVAAVVRGGRASDTLSAGEMGVVGLVVIAALLAPSVLVVRHVRSSMWESTMKLLTLLSALRRPLLFALVGFGSLALLLRLVELVVMRHALSVAWPLWDALLAVVALATGAIVALRGGKAEEAPPPRPATVGVVAAIAFLSIALVSAMRDEPAVAAPTASAEGDTPAAASSEEPEDDAAKRAPVEALASARAAGSDALVELRTQYPSDPEVLRALVLARAAEKNGTAAALEAAAELFALAPEQAAGPDMTRLITNAAKSKDKAISAQAFALMGTKMGARGPDLLYELARKERRLAKRANDMLADDAVIARASPALRIALELKKAEKCDAVKLLDRAAKDGDERAVAILSPLGKRRPRGCSPFGLGACPPRCKDDADKILATIETIEARTKP